MINLTLGLTVRVANRFSLRIVFSCLHLLSSTATLRVLSHIFTRLLTVGNLFLSWCFVMNYNEAIIALSVSLFDRYEKTRAEESTDASTFYETRKIIFLFAAFWLNDAIEKASAAWVKQHMSGRLEQTQSDGACMVIFPTKMLSSRARWNDVLMLLFWLWEIFSGATQFFI